MSLSGDQKKFYENTMAVTRQGDHGARGADPGGAGEGHNGPAWPSCRTRRRRARQMYDAACMRLGIPNDLDDSEARR